MTILCHVSCYGVWCVWQNGPASQSGQIQPGDLLHSIDGESMVFAEVAYASSKLAGAPYSKVTLGISE